MSFLQAASEIASGVVPGSQWQHIAVAYDLVARFRSSEFPARTSGMKTMCALERGQNRVAGKLGDHLAAQPMGPQYYACFLFLH